MSEPADNKRIEDSTVQSHPFKAHYHGTETGDRGYLAIESGYIIPGGFFGGFEAILPKFAGNDLQDQHHTGDLTHIFDPAVGDYYVEATGEWRTTGSDGDKKIEMFEPHTAEVKHHGQLTLTDDKKRALKVFRLESDGRITQYIKSDIPMSFGRTAEVPPVEPPDGGSSASSASSSSSMSSSSASEPGSWPYPDSSSSGSTPYKWATFVQQDYVPLWIPTTSTSNVQVRMQNTGTIPWYPTVDKLVPRGYGWGLYEVPVPAITPPGSTREFNFEIKAPAIPGIYPFQWQMFGEGLYFGYATDKVDINVYAPPMPASSSSSSAAVTYENNAAFVHWFIIPDEVETEDTLWVQITMRNVGDTIWYPGQHKLVPIGHDWGMFEIPLVTETRPGVERTFDVECYAPAIPGVYDFQWQMAGPSGSFGATTPNKQINVVQRTTSISSSSSSSSSSSPQPPSSSGSSSSEGIGGPSSNNATFVNQYPIPIEIVAGSSADVQVTFRNVGDNAWTSGQHKLVSKVPDFNTFWGFSQQMVSNTTYVGAERTFYLHITAPATTGNYPFRWQMHDMTSFFGQLTPDVIITVTALPSSSSSS